MTGQWTADTIRLMRDAAEHEPYYETLAAEIARQLPPGARVCDAGCGLGYLAMHLARRGFAVTAADLSADALAVLENHCAQEGVPEGVSIDIRCGDIACMPPQELYDAMAFCLFGSLKQILRIAAQQCRGDVFIAARNYSMHRFAPGARRCRRESLQDMMDILREEGIPFDVKEMTIPFGQPLKNKEDARLFFSLYSRGETVTDAFIDSRIAATGDAEFPYYMPHRRDIGLLHIRAEDIPAAYRQEESREDRG